mgnify:CR=1 FL=1
MLSYKLEKFEGPLDLLPHLIEKIKSAYTIFRFLKLQISIWSMSMPWRKRILILSASFLS